MDAGSILRACRFFSRVHPERLAHLISLSQVERHPKGTLLFREDEPCPGMYVMGDGLVRVYKTTPQGKEHVLHLVSAGGTFLEVAAIGGLDNPAYGQTLEDSIMVLIPTDKLTTALATDHALCLELMASMARWVKHLVDLMEDIALRDAAGRLARFLLDAPSGTAQQICLPARKKHLASHLNLTSETLSRTLRRFLDAGLVRSLDEVTLEVLDVEGLMRVASGEFPRL